MRKWYIIPTFRLSSQLVAVGSIEFLLTLLVIFNIFDIAATYMAMSYGVEEANPITQSLIALLMLKVIFIGVLIGISHMITDFGKKLLSGAVVVYGMITVYHLYYLNLLA